MDGQAAEDAYLFVRPLVSGGHLEFAELADGEIVEGR